MLECSRLDVAELTPQSDRNLVTHRALTVLPVLSSPKGLTLESGQRSVQVIRGDHVAERESMFGISIAEEGPTLGDLGCPFQFPLIGALLIVQ
jgi:hypothetical protein